MALPGGGSLSLSQIQDEFGGTNPISLSEYYKGGGLVPDIEGVGESIPESGAISIGDFLDATSILPNPFAVGDTMFNQVNENSAFAPTSGACVSVDPDNNSNTYNAYCENWGLVSGWNSTVFDETYTFNPLEDYGNFKVIWSTSATSSYYYIYVRVLLYIDDVLIYDGRVGSGSTLSGQDTKFRDFTGTVSKSSPDIQLGFGQEVRLRVITRNRTGYNNSEWNARFGTLPSMSRLNFRVERVS